MKPIFKATIKGESLQLMRKYHNEEKYTVLKKEFNKGDVIIDIGSGQGGDLRKWEKVGFGHVYVLEPNSENMIELKRRQKQSDYQTPITTLSFGAEKTNALNIVIEQTTNGKLDGIVSFFSLTFFPERKNKYNSLLNTIDLLPKGGKFVGIVMDGYKVRDLLEETRLQEEIPINEAVDYFSGGTEEYSAFTIRQGEYEFDDNVIGNEILINIPTTMVTDQIEYLFYFESFRRKLKEKGFKLISQSFLDKGRIYDKLPRQAKEFTKLNRVFVFQKFGKSKKKFRNVDLKTDNRRKFVNPYEKDLYYIGTELDPSNFIHAILHAISPEYVRMISSERVSYAQKIRCVIARKLTQEFFEHLHKGEFARRLQNPYLKKYEKEEAKEIAFLEFKLKLMGDTDFIGEINMLELTSKIFGIDIYVLSGLEIEPSKKYAEECDKLYVNNKAVILYTIDNIKYHLVTHLKGGKYYYLFDTSSSLIKKLYRIVCGK